MLQMQVKASPQQKRTPDSNAVSLSCCHRLLGHLVVSCSSQSITIIQQKQYLQPCLSRAALPLTGVPATFACLEGMCPCALVHRSGQIPILHSMKLPCRAKFPLVEIFWPLQTSPGKISPRQPGFACQLSQLWRHRHRPRGRSEQAEPASAYRRKPERQRKRRSSEQVEKS